LRWRLHFLLFLRRAPSHQEGPWVVDFQITNSEPLLVINQPALASATSASNWPGEHATNTQDGFSF